MSICIQSNDFQTIHPSIHPLAYSLIYCSSHVTIILTCYRDVLFNYRMASPARIIELQKYYQTTNKPLWRAHPNANLVLIPYFAAFTVSLGAALYYTGRAAFGIKDSK